MPSKHFRHFLEGHPFTLYTDHRPLTTALTSKTDRSPRQTRQLSYIAEFTTDIRHIKGQFNVVADALSRINTISFGQNAEDAKRGCFSETKLAHQSNITHYTLQNLPMVDLERLARDQKQSGEMSMYHNATTMRTRCPDW